MATREQIYAALKNADAAGDSESVKKLGAYLSTMAPPKPDVIEEGARNFNGDQGFLQNVRTGIGRGMASVGRGLSQAAGGAVDAVLPAPSQNLSGLITGAKPKPYSERLGFIQPSDVDEAKRLDAQLMQSTGGKVGNIIGNAAIAAPVAFIPGANTLLGAAATGAAYGGLTTEGDGNERLLGAGLGGAGSLGGVVLGRVAGAGADRLKNARIQAQTANAGKDAAITTAQQAGYRLPPTEVNPSVVNNLLEGLSGKVKTSQKASTQNQAVTNRLAQQELGLPDGPITKDALEAIRHTQGQNYEAVRNTGLIQPTAAYDTALDAVAAPYARASAGFPNSKPSPMLAEIESLRSPQFDASSAVDKISALRNQADMAYRAGDKNAGKTFKDLAGTLEDAIDSHISQAGPSDLLNNFRNARATIAKTYSVEKALNASTGDISAAALTKQLERGRPLSNNLRTIAEVNQAFPKATQTLQQSYNAVSPLDYAAGMMGSVGTGNPLMALAMAARPAVRSAILSGPVQSRLGAQTYGPNKLLELLRDNRALPIAGMVAPTY